MIRIKSFFIFCFLLLGGVKSPASSFLVQDVPSKDFLRMDGTTLEHIFDTSHDSLSEQRIIELQDRDGLTTWFGRYFNKDICTTGICRMVTLWIIWDGSGNFLGMQFEESNPLTKSDHTPFKRKDYERLYEIMADTASILKDLLYEDLTVEVPKDETNKTHFNNLGIYEIDGYSSATVPSLKEYVVEDAVFTCYTLWHTVYGETKQYIDSLLQKRMNPTYLVRLFNGDKGQQILALKNIESWDKWSNKIESQVLKLITSSDLDIAEKALSLITAKYLSEEERQLRFVELIKHARPEIKYEILYKLQTATTLLPDTLLLLLDLFITGDIRQGAFNHLLKIIEIQATANESINNNKIIRERVEKLASYSDPYTSSLAKSFTRKMKW